MASISEKESRWYFASEQLQNSPSRKCSIDAETELMYRQRAANLIQDMGQRLHVYPFFKCYLMKKKHF